MSTLKTYGARVKFGQALGTASKPFMREILGVFISYLFRSKMETLNNFHHKEYIKIFST
jgi:hypothetical protein